MNFQNVTDKMHKKLAQKYIDSLNLIESSATQSVLQTTESTETINETATEEPCQRKTPLKRKRSNDEGATTIDSSKLTVIQEEEVSFDK